MQPFDGSDLGLNCLQRQNQGESSNHQKQTILEESTAVFRHPITLHAFCCLLITCFLLSADFFQNQLIGKILSGLIPSECKTVWTFCRA